MQAAAICERTPGWNLRGSSPSRSSAYRAYQAASCAASLALNGPVSPLRMVGLVRVVLTAQANRIDVAAQHAALLSRSRSRIANVRRRLERVTDLRVVVDGVEQVVESRSTGWHRQDRLVADHSAWKAPAL